MFAIRGLTCASCALDAGRGVLRIPGVRDANINYMVDKGYVDYDPELVSWDRVEKALRARGYAVVRTR